MSKLSKSLAAIVLVAAIAAGAWFFKDQILDLFASEVDNPQAILNEAVNNGLNIKSAAFDMKIKVNIDDQASTKGAIKLDLNGQNTDVAGFLADLEYKIKADVDFTADGQAIQAGGTFDFKIVDETIYAQFSKITLPDLEIPELAQVNFFIEMFKDKWYAIPLGQLMEQNPEAGAVLVQQKELQKELIETFKKSFSKEDIYLVKSAKAIGGKYIMSVEPNFDLIISEEFLEPIFKIIASSPQAEIEPFVAPSAEEISEARKIVKAIYAQINPEILLTISKADKLITGQKITAAVDLSKLDVADKPEDAKGVINLSIVSNAKSFNQVDTIEAPTDFVDFSDLIPQPAPVGTESVDTENAEDEGLLLENVEMPTESGQE